jgi:tryptophan 7-halogenase
MVPNSNKQFRLAVVGVGSAGIVTLSVLMPWLSNKWDVVSVYDPETPILGIGESTNPNFIAALQTGMQFSHVEDLKELDGTFKFGTKYINWREHDWVNPLFGAGVAAHFNNFKLKDFAFKRFKDLWPKKFKVLEGKVESIENGFNCANIKINNNIEKFDYVIDCRGFPTDYTNYHISDCSPVNTCFVYSVPPHLEELELYTEHIATEHGWTFGIPLTTRHTYGYLFNSDLTDDANALTEMSTMFSKKIEKEDVIEYKFKSYYSKKIMDGRILLNGNRALFFEPLSASSIFCYVAIADMFAQHLSNTKKYDSFFMNTNFDGMAKSLEDMLSYLYHGGSMFDSKFWNFARHKAITRLNKSKMFADTVAEYKKNDAQGTPLVGTPWFFSPTNLRIIDKKLNYNYFKE